MGPYQRGGKLTMRKRMASVALILTVADLTGGSMTWRQGYIAGATHSLVDVGNLACGPLGVSAHMVEATVETMIQAGVIKAESPMSEAVMMSLFRLGCRARQEKPNA